MDGTDRETSRESGGVKVPILLLVLRLLLVIGFQFVAFGLTGSLQEAMPWWPYSIVLVEVVTLIGLVVLMRRENRSVASLLVSPFEQRAGGGPIGEFLGRRFEPRWIGLAADLGRFALVLGVLGIPAIALNEMISSNVSVLREAATVGALPAFAVRALFFLLPAAQLVEFPFYFGYIGPRLEAAFAERGASSRAAGIGALAIVVVALAIQMATLPIVVSGAYVVWQMIAVLPLLIVIGAIIRTVPRFMLGANIVHMVMAVMVVLEFWRV